MLKNLLVIALAVLTLASCSKDKNDTPAYSLSAKIDGAAQAFNTGVSAQKAGDATTGYSVAIAGVAGTASSPYPAFALSIESDSPIVAKTYTATALEAGAMYITDATTMLMSNTDFTITVTSVTDTDIRGTFSGKIEAKVVSEGAFSAKFQ
jgi:hypothetical protein